jgi:PAS domain S-box-containing protein
VEVDAMYDSFLHDSKPGQLAGDTLLRNEYMLILGHDKLEEETGKPPNLFDRVPGECAGVQDLSDIVEQASTKAGLQRSTESDRQIEEAETRVEQAKTRTEQANTQREQASTQARQASTRTKQASTRREQASTQAEQDSTRTKQAETRTAQALHASELSYRRLFEAAKDGILILNGHTGRIDDVNPFLFKLLGFSRCEMIGKTIGELSPFNDIEPNKVMLERLQKDGYVRYENLPLETKDGRHVAVEFISNVYQAGDDKVIQCDVRDITERKRLESLSNQLAAIVASSDDAIFSRGLDGTIMTSNAAAERLFGYEPEELIGRNIAIILPESSKTEETAILAKLRKGEGIRHFETTRIKKDGTSIPVSLTISPMKDDSGNLMGFSNIVRDITERKKAEAAIHDLNDTLEQRVKDRTAELETANKELESFSYSVSHDLRSPLRSIDGFSRVLLEDFGDKLGEEGKDSLRRVRMASQRMGELIDDLLQLSQLTRSEMCRTPLDLSALARTVAHELANAQPGRRVEFVIEPNLAATADASLMQVVLTNLLGNAWKFTSKLDDARIEFGRTNRERVHAFFVRDNGVGFDMAYVHKLFGAFQRLHDSTEFPGTGIGLTNVQRVIHRHKGRVWAESEPNHGATFYFTLADSPKEL